MLIRRAVKEDIEGMIKLLYQVNLLHHNGRPDLFRVGTKYDRAELEVLVKDDEKPIFVAIQDEKVVGYAFCVIQRQTDHSILTDVKTLYIDDLCVDEPYRGSHIGTKLLDHVTSYAEKIHCYNITLNVWAMNQTAYKFYSDADFKPLKTCMEKKLRQ